MIRVISIANLIAVMSCGVFGQIATERPAFEVASIKMYSAGSPIPQGSGRNGVPSSSDGITARYTKLWACLEWAYDIPGRVFGPDWIFSERYDIVAKAAKPVSQEQLKLMLQRLLTERFKLTLHREMKELPVIALVVTKNGPKNLNAVEAAGTPDIQQGDGKLALKNVSLSRLADVLIARPPYGLNGQKVVDQTGIAGVFDITLPVREFNLDDPQINGNMGAMDEALLDYFSTTLEKQYGLKLERRRIPLESLIVDNGNRVPTEN